jgi:hypothetical protein
MFSRHWGFRNGLVLPQTSLAIGLDRDGGLMEGLGDVAACDPRDFGPRLGVFDPQDNRTAAFLDRPGFPTAQPPERIVEQRLHRGTLDRPGVDAQNLGARAMPQA